MNEGVPALVLLAAGGSRRMGSCKALKEYGGVPAILRLLDAGFDPNGPVPLVVSGPTDAELRVLLGERAEVVHNRDWERGRASSLRRAQAARPGQDLLLAPVDHPLVPAGAFAALRRSWAHAGAPSRGWLGPRVERPGKPPAFGHPILVGRALAATLETLGDGDSLRDLRALAEPLLSVPCGPEVLWNLDEPTDAAPGPDRENPST